MARRQQSFTNDGNEDSQIDTQQSICTTILHYIEQASAPWKEYTSRSVFLASFAMSLLYLTVLSFGTTMVTYLLHTGFSPMEVSSMRIGSVIAELSGTWAAPFIMDRIGPIRSGLWFLNWQSACLAAAAAGFVFLDAGSRMVAIILIISVALSRIGLWGFDLSVQFLVQEVIPTFSLSIESSLTDLVRSIEHRRACQSAIFLHRDGTAERFRASILCHHHLLPLARAIQIPGADQLRSHRVGGCLLCWVCSQGTRASAAPIQVHWG